MIPMADTFFSGKRLTRFEALQAALVPRSQQLGVGRRAESRAIVEKMVSGQPPEKRRKLAIFLVLIDVISFFVGLRPFRRLPPAKQRRVLGWLFDCPIGLLRKGFWGLNTLARAGVYAQPDLYPEVGYHLRENPGA